MITNFEFLKIIFIERESNSFTSKGLLIIRLITGLGMVLHGIPKLMAPTAWMGDAVPGFFQLLGVLSEVLGGLVLIIGLLVPLASLFITITMLVGILFVHVANADPLYRITVSNTNEGPGTDFFGLPLWFAKAGGHSDFGSGSAELAILYLIISIALFFSGAGKYSLDYYFAKARKNK